MLFSLFSTRLLLRHGVSNSATAVPIVRRVPTQFATRSFSVTRAIMDPAKADSSETKIPKGTTAAKSKSTSSKKTSKEKLSTKDDEKKPMKIRSEDMPPKRAPGAYTIFYTKFVAKNVPSSTEHKFNVVAAAKEAASLWNNFSEHEKQAFKDEAETLKAEYEKKKEEYFKNVDPVILKEINKRRAAKGLAKIRAPPKSDSSKSPTPPFFLFVSDERKNLTLASGREALTQMRDVAKSAGAKWRTMSDAEKQPYVDKAKELNAQKASEI